MVKGKKVLWIGIFVLMIAIAMFLVAVFDKRNSNEASIGDFSVNKFNDGWTLIKDGEEKDITLPTTLGSMEGSFSIKNKLPKDIFDGMQLCVRGSMEDVCIYIDGELREKYTSDQFEKDYYYYIPSAYIFVSLNADDAQKDIRIDFVAKKTGNINEVEIAYGNNSWFGIIKRNIIAVIIAVLVALFGFAACLGYLFIHKNVAGAKSLLFIGFVLISVGMWMISESEIRQLIFSRPSYSEYFSYFFIELVGVFVAAFYDESQNMRYHKMYCMCYTLMISQIIINVILNQTKLVYFHKTIMVSHLFFGFGIIVSIVSIIKDIKSGNVENYIFTSIGMFTFVVSAIIEIFVYYFARNHVFGIYLGLGLLVLVFMTMVQIVKSQITFFKKTEDNREKMTMSTLETIASTIDAKDTYTGGHSNRVGKYAEVLAKNVAEDYGFDEDEIKRIKYIGRMHDIGKIGVADSILNKPGRLDDEEFAAMKAHTTIGDDILSRLDYMEGLSEGVRSHHERYDGKGYPDGLSGEDIPVIARILCLADSYDAMATDRVYRKRLTDDVIINEIRRCSGTQFDPKLAEVFCRLIEEGKIQANN